MTTLSRTLLCAALSLASLSAHSGGAPYGVDHLRGTATVYGYAITFKTPSTPSAAPQGFKTSHTRSDGRTVITPTPTTRASALHLSKSPATIASDIANILSDGTVSSVVPVYHISPASHLDSPDPSNPTGTGLAINWPNTANSAPRVAILDTGYLPSLSSPTAAASFDSSLSNGIDIDGSCPTLEPHHGSNVSFILTQAQNASVLHGRVIGCNGGSTDALIRGIDWAIANQARVINLSLAGEHGIPCPSDVQDAINRALNSGIHVVAAAGNSPLQPLPFPASCNGVIPVSASQPNGTIAPFSAFSPNSLTAPGVNIPLPNNANGSGTSYAAPLVSAALAQLISLLPNSSRSLRDYLLYEYASPISSCNLPSCGYGHLNMAHASRVAATTLFDINANTKTLPSSSVPLNTKICISNNSTRAGLPAHADLDPSSMSSQGFALENNSWCQIMRTPGSFSFSTPLIHNSFTIPHYTSISVSPSPAPSVSNPSASLKKLFNFGPNSNAAEVREGSQHVFDLSSIANNNTLRISWIASNGFSAQTQGYSLIISAPQNSAGTTSTLKVETVDNLGQISSNFIELSFVSLQTLNPTPENPSSGGGGDSSILLLAPLALFSLRRHLSRP